jgi:hypothetical protein
MRPKISVEGELENRGLHYKIEILCKIGNRN